MKKYALIDWKDGDMFEDVFDTSSEAIKTADYQWTHLTNSERKKRKMFDVMYGEVDENGCFDINTAKTIKSYKA